jgi:uncharacterized membrane protein
MNIRRGLPPPWRSPRRGRPAPSFAEVERIVSTRCSMCHAAEPVWPSLATAPKAIRLDEAGYIRGMPA